MAKVTKIIPELKTNYMKGTLEFYTQVLGFKIDSRWPETDNPDWVSLSRDSISIRFNTHHARHTREFSGRLYFLVDDLDGLYEQVKGSARVEKKPTEQFYGMREFAIEDPNHYQLTFAAATTD
jgi:uncharacterized glyoxalase superfamily protein PhnB